MSEEKGSPLANGKVSKPSKPKPSKPKPRTKKPGKWKHVLLSLLPEDHDQIKKAAALQMRDVTNYIRYHIMRAVAMQLGEAADKAANQ